MAGSLSALGNIFEEDGHLGQMLPTAYKLVRLVPSVVLHSISQ